MAVANFLLSAREWVVYNQLLEFLENSDFLEKEQHGFRLGQSTVTEWANFIDSLINGIDKDENVLEIFFDLTKAFDCQCGVAL